VNVTTRIVTETEGVRQRGQRHAGKEIQMAEIQVRSFGIPPEQISFIFRRFVRLPLDLASTITGNGLGIYLCRVLAEAMHGRIWVESEGVAGKGSTFYLRLLLAPSR
jgi:signal transduction histidine kinase